MCITTPRACELGCTKSIKIGTLKSFFNRFQRFYTYGLGMKFRFFLRKKHFQKLLGFSGHFSLSIFSANFEDTKKLLHKKCSSCYAKYFLFSKLFWKKINSFVEKVEKVTVKRRFECNGASSRAIWRPCTFCIVWYYCASLIAN